VLGDNDSGKTTLFNCIYGTEKYKGEILRSSNVTYLPNELFFYPRVRGIEFLKYACEINGVKADLEKIDQINEYFKLPLRKFAANYSTVMKKKLGLISVLLQNSDIYLLDEPFTGLDYEGAMVTRQLIKSLAGNEIVVLVSSHIMEHVKEVCSVIHFLESGCINRSYESGSFSEIYSDMEKRYSEINFWMDI
jgi:ABC-2 type transport system ATP-binding protein